MDLTALAIRGMTPGMRLRPRPQMLSRAVLAATFVVTALSSACADPPLPRLPPSGVASATAPGREPIASSALVPIETDDPMLGPNHARTTIIVWSDYQCPYCARAEKTLRRLRESYAGDLRIVWKDAPLKFHKHARFAALAARTAFVVKGPEAFWTLHDALFEHQAALSKETILDLAAEVGISEGQIEAHRPAAETKIRESQEQAAGYGLDGTPAFLVDGEKLVGAKPYDVFASLLDAHLSEATKLAGQGVPPQGIYDALVRAHVATKTSAPEEVVIDETVHRVEVGSAPVRGPADALVTLVVFADFQCPFCKSHAQTIAELEAKYAGKIRVAFKHLPLPFHARATPAAMLAIEARKQGGDAKFWAAHDALFGAAPKLDDEALLRVAGELGLDVPKAKLAIGSNVHRRAIDDDLDDAAEVDVEGTPNTFVNGRRVGGSQPLPVFVKLVDEELSRAQSMVASGVPKAKLYETIIANGKTARVDLPVPKDAPWTGGADAKVVVQVFSDYQCPHCRRLALIAVDGQPPVTDDASGGIERVEKRYGNKIKIVFRDYPLPGHPFARPAAALAREAWSQSPKVFYEVMRALFTTYPLDREAIVAIGKKHGVTAKGIAAAVDGTKWDAKLDEDVQAASEVGLVGTPAIVVNGRVLRGAQPETVIARAIDRALARVK